jgi:hypothetical protein
MQSRDGMFALILVALIILVIIFGVRSATNSARADAAERMSTVLIDLLKAEEYTSAYKNCSGLRPDQYDAIKACLLIIKEPNDLTALFKQDDYQNTAKDGTPGYLVIQNAKGAKTFQSANFTLRKNNVAAGTGCTTPGAIEPGFTCRFDLVEPCAPGDNLEITYQGKRVFLKTC